MIILENNKVHTLFASCCNISNVTWWTSAVCTVVINSTLSWFYARVVFGARIDTFSVYASFVTWTIRVGTTAGHYTSYLWISNPTWWTFTNGLMVDSIAFGIRTTTATVCCAHSNANAVDTSVLTRTIGFTSTPGCNKHIFIKNYHYNYCDSLLHTIPLEQSISGFPSNPAKQEQTGL